MANLRWWRSQLFGEGDPIPLAVAEAPTQVVIASQRAVIPMTARSISDITVRMEPEGEPKFKRIYTVRLPSSRSMEITMKSYGGILGRSSGGELTQSNGRWVLFDPDRIADKILDPEIVPVIERYVEEIFVMDSAFLASKPKEFIDERGQKWVRA